jgi:hypothetical protein
MLGNIKMKNIKKLIFRNNIRISLALLLFAATLVLSFTMFSLQKKKIMIKSTITISQEFKNLFSTYSFLFDKSEPDYQKWFNLVIEKITGKFNDRGYVFFDSRLAYFANNVLSEDYMFSIENNSTQKLISINLIVYLKKENSYQNFYLVKNQVKKILIDSVRENSPLDMINGIYEIDDIYAQTEDKTNKNSNEKKNIIMDEFKLKYFQFINSEFNNREVTETFPLQITDYLVENKWNSFFYYFIYCFHSSILFYIFFFLLKNKKRK